MWGMVLAEVGVLLRSAVIGAVFYAIWGAVSGAGMTWSGYAKIVAVLFVLANVAFFGASRLRPGLVRVAREIEERANDQFR